jgi:hypothetical protein
VLVATPAPDGQGTLVSAGCPRRVASAFTAEVPPRMRPCTIGMVPASVVMAVTVTGVAPVHTSDARAGSYTDAW